ncbi:hypothetical protein J1N35_043880 [Gossypium stocksii]|uniref:Uncharacterized protein n=1 Tax=Gossypium stocksii TaxID=47602 RepID=A0A9D3U7Y5_9ROSI|nr:hypothetical protein J1N35_043880 [Gossypium stocksii]
MPSRDICLFKQNIRTCCKKAQLERLRTGSPLIIEDLVIVRNVFLYYLKGRSPNKYRSGDSKEAVEALWAITRSQSWPHEIYSNINSDDLG